MFNLSMFLAGISVLTLHTADSYSLTQPSVKSRSDWRSRPVAAQNSILREILGRGE